MADIKILEFSPDHIDQALALWKSCEGIGLSAADEPLRIRDYLFRNSGISFTAWQGTNLVGAVLCGHDGRRGFLHHLAVHPEYRERGIGKLLVERCHGALQQVGIDKVHIFVYAKNLNALEFWKAQRYIPRDELVLLSANILAPED